MNNKHAISSLLWLVASPQAIHPANKISDSLDCVLFSASRSLSLSYSLSRRFFDWISLHISSEVIWRCWVNICTYIDVTIAVLARKNLSHPLLHKIIVFVCTIQLTEHVVYVHCSVCSVFLSLSQARCMLEHNFYCVHLNIDINLAYVYVHITHRLTSIGCFFSFSTVYTSRLFKL